MPEEEEDLKIIITVAATGEPMIVANGPLPILTGIALLDLAKEKMMGQYWAVVQENAKKAALLEPKLFLP